jgi:hypothetical protein
MGIGGWSGGTVVDIAANGDVVLAATFAGVFRSTDRGENWHWVGRELPDWFIQTVALAPMGNQVLGLAASHMGWLYRSTDEGETWEVASYWRDQGIITRLVPSPMFERDGIVFACTEEDGIFKSVDRGMHWKQASFGLLNLCVTALCFSPDFDQDEVVFAGTEGGGLFRSRNAGRAWRESGEGLPDSAVQCLAVSPDFGQDGIVFAGTEDRGLYRSIDGGRTWSPIGDVMTEVCVNGLRILPDWTEKASIVAATDQGMLVSSDSGETWQASPGGGDYPYTIALCKDRLLAGTYEEGIYRSIDGGTTWQGSNDGLAAHLPPMTCFSDSFDQDRTLIMSSMEGSIVRTKDAGCTWESLQFEDDEFAASLITGTGSGDSMTVLAAQETNLLLSQSSGEQWADLFETGEPISAIALSETYERDSTMLVGTSSGRVMSSSDEGKSWDTVASFDGEAVLALATYTKPDQSSTYAVTALQTEMGTWELALRGGTGWQTVAIRESDEPVGVLSFDDRGHLFCALGRYTLHVQADRVSSEGELSVAGPISCLAPTEDGLLAGTRFGLCRSEDRGTSWKVLTSDISAVALHTASANRVYVVSMGGLLWEVDLT